MIATAQSYALEAGAFLRQGEPLLAYDRVLEALDSFPGDLRLRQLAGLSLARAGALGRARELLEELRSEGLEDEETLGILAGVYKRMGLATGSPARKKEFLEKAYALYRRAFDAGGEDRTYAGINAAAMAQLLGHSEESRQLAGYVRAACEARLDPPPAESAAAYWLHASLGEAMLLLGDLQAAATAYRRAAETSPNSYADLAAARGQARLLLKRMGHDPALAAAWLRLPAVVSFAGHMVDRPGRLNPRFPAKLEAAVRIAIEGELGRLNAGIGYSSTACGADIIFLEAMLARGGEIHVVLPFGKDEFVSASVDLIPGSNWAKRFDKVLSKAASVTVAGEDSARSDPRAFQYATQVQNGLAILRAGQLGVPVRALAVWDRQPGDGVGGTDTFVSDWVAKGVAPIIIAPGQLKAEPLRRSRKARAAAQEQRPNGRRGRSAAPPSAIRAMLFADAVGFSRLSEAQLPAFQKAFLGTIGRMADRSAHAPVFRNTWGDGLFFVFDRIADAGIFALELQEALDRVDWSARGLPPMSLRIGLHAGPASVISDPVTHRINYLGAHVNRAARIEPVTPPGFVFASEAFAALTAGSADAAFVCEYAGQVALAKKYGTFRMYHLRRRRS